MTKAVRPRSAAGKGRQCRYGSYSPADGGSRNSKVSSKTSNICLTRGSSSCPSSRAWSGSRPLEAGSIPESCGVVSWRAFSGGGLSDDGRFTPAAAKRSLSRWPIRDTWLATLKHRSAGLSSSTVATNPDAESGRGGHGESWRARYADLLRHVNHSLTLAPKGAYSWITSTLEFC